MKKIIQTLVICLTTISFSQTPEVFDYEKFSNPSPDNELSKHFKKAISKKLLSEAKFLPKKNNITLSFLINKDNEPYKINIDLFGGADLKKAIIDAFEKYPLERLNLDTINKQNKYSFQIISEKRGEKIFDCSSKIIVESPSIVNSCQDLEFYEDLKKCLTEEVEKHFFDTVDFSTLKGETDLSIKLAISKDGELINKDTEVPSSFEGEIEKVLQSFPKTNRVRTVNGVAKESLINLWINIDENEKPVYKEPYTAFRNYTKPNPTSKLSEFFLKNLSEELIKKANLNRINNTLTISFEIHKRKATNIKTNARSNSLEKEIISVFKKFPVKKLKIADKKRFNRYTVQILSFKDNKNIINASSITGYMKPPVYKGCSTSKSFSKLKKCFSKSVQKHFSKKFDASLPNNLGLTTGRIRVFIGFKIDKNGYVSNTKVKLSKKSPKLKAEVERVMKLIPKMTSSAFRNGKRINIKYSIPFTLIVE